MRNAWKFFPHHIKTILDYSSPCPGLITLWHGQFPNSPWYRFGRPGVECYCQHESGAAVIQLQFLINEVSAFLRCLPPSLLPSLPPICLALFSMPSSHALNRNLFQVAQLIPPLTAFVVKIPLVLLSAPMQGTNGTLLPTGTSYLFFYAVYCWLVALWYKWHTCQHLCHSLDIMWLDTLFSEGWN